MSISLVLLGAASIALALWVLWRARSRRAAARRLGRRSLDGFREFAVDIGGRRIQVLGSDPGGRGEIVVVAPGTFGEARHGLAAVRHAARRGYAAYSVGVLDGLTPDRSEFVPLRLARDLAAVIDEIAAGRRVRLACHSAAALGGLLLARGVVRPQRAEVVRVLLLGMPGLALSLHLRVAVDLLGSLLIRLPADRTTLGRAPARHRLTWRHRVRQAVEGCLERRHWTFRGWIGLLVRPRTWPGFRSVVMLTWQLDARRLKPGPWVVPTRLLYWGGDRTVAGRRSVRRAVRRRLGPVRLLPGGSHNSWFRLGPDARDVVDLLLELPPNPAPNWADLALAA